MPENIFNLAVPRSKDSHKPGPLRHGHKRGNGESKIHSSWRGMKERCLNPKNKAYQWYGGTGVSICESWLTFENFLNDMGPSWLPGMSLERRENTKPYSFSNCRWATQKEQMNNTRRNRKIFAFGKTMNLSQWAESTGIDRMTITARIKRGRSNEQALTPYRAP